MRKHLKMVVDNTKKPKRRSFYDRYEEEIRFSIACLVVLAAILFLGLRGK